MMNRRLKLRGCPCCVAVTPAALPVNPRRRVHPCRIQTLSQVVGSNGGAPLIAAAASSAAASAQSGGGTANASKPHRIDTHHHIAPPKFMDEMRALLQPPTLAWSIEKSLEDMDRAGVATSITSITT